MQKISKWPAIVVIKIFHIFHPLLHQVLISIFGFSSTCRQTPTCSEYTIFQIEKRGTITGLKLGFQRVLACHT